MDTVQQIEAQLVMRNYEGFEKKGKLRSRRYDVARANIQVSNIPLRCPRHFGRRRDYVRFHGRAHHAVLRKLHVRCGRNYLCLRGSHARHRSSRRIERNGRHDRSRCNDVGHGDVVVELQIGRCHDGLRSVVGLWRNRENRLLRVGGLAFLRFRRCCRTGVERREIFVWRIGYDRRAVKWRLVQNFLLPDPRKRNHAYQGNCCSMQQCGLHKTSPRKRSMNEDVTQIEFCIDRQFCWERVGWLTVVREKRGANPVSKLWARGIVINQES